jgi:hypothetical protein
LRNFKTAPASSLSVRSSRTKWRKFENARREFGEKAEAFISECYSLSEAFALSLKPAKASDQIKARLMEMVKNRQAH